MHMIKEIFPTKIYHTRYPGDIQQLKEDLLPQLEPVFEKTKQNNQGSMQQNGLCSYNVARDLHTWPVLHDYTEWLKQEIKECWKYFDYVEGGDLLYDMWANKYPPGSFIAAHNHAPLTVTISFYLQKQEHSGNLVFENPNSNILKYQPTNALQNLDKYHELFDYEVNTSEGDVVMFPAWLTHKTTPHANPNSDIIIGANAIGAYNV